MHCLKKLAKNKGILKNAKNYPYSRFISFSSGFFLSPKRENVRIENSFCLPIAGGFLINAAFKINLSGEAQKALKSGIGLNFNYEFKAGIEKKFLSRRLSYNHLSNNYQVDFLEDKKSLSFLDLRSALSAMDLNNLIIEFKNKANSPVMRLNFSQRDLPFSLRFNSLVNNDWDLSSGWRQICSI